jgi:hypothetical protein
MDYIMRLNRFKIIKLSFLVLGLIPMAHIYSQGSSGQNLVNSPYSNYGVGEWTNTQFYHSGFAPHTFSGHYSYSLSNPATLGTVRYAVLDMGGSFKNGATTAGGERFDFQGGGFEYLSLALPVWKHVHKKRFKNDTSLSVKRWNYIPYGASSALTLKPLTSLGYSYYLDDNSAVLPTRTSHIGSGGISALQWTTGIRLGNSIQLGYGIGYLFGNTKDNALFSVIDSLELGIVEDARSLKFRGMQQQAGVLFEYKMDSTYHKFGASIEWNSSVNATRNRLSRTLEVNAVGYTSVLDTILNTQDVKKTIQLPMSFGLGYSFRYRRLFLASVDWRRQSWSGYSAYFDNFNQYRDRDEWTIGLIFNPMDEKLSNEKHMKIPVRFSVGRANSQIQLTQNNTNYGVMEDRVSIGFGIPMIRRYYDNSVITNMLNIQFSYLNRYTRNSNLPRDEFFTVGLGFQFGDIWFAKRKYD